MTDRAFLYTCNRLFSKRVDVVVCPLLVSVSLVVPSASPLVLVVEVESLLLMNSTRLFLALFFPLLIGTHPEQRLLWPGACMRDGGLRLLI